MKNMLLALALFSYLSIAQEDKGLSERWFKVLPEKDSLASFGFSSLKELPLSIRAVVWNIKKAQMSEWKNEFQHYAAGRDLFFIQEAYESDIFTSTIDSTGHQWDMGISFLYRSLADAATGSMVGSSASPLDVFVKHSVDREPIFQTPKALIFAKYNLKNKEEDLLVVSVHAINFDTTGAFKRQMDQIEVEVKNHSGPVIVAGDFNTWNEARTKYLLQMAGRLSLTEAQYTNDEYRMKFRGWPLDHIFTRGVTVKSSVVVKESKGSDHKPFLVDLTIP
jgi:endonuclease/exonuclease/phosphatase (EEP) superfamily protein YafD